jgi:hypothetical protein
MNLNSLLKRIWEYICIFARIGGIRGIVGLAWRPVAKSEIVKTPRISIKVWNNARLKRGSAKIYVVCCHVHSY